MEPRDTYSLMTEIRKHGGIEMSGGEGGLPLADALDLARTRSSFVVLGVFQFPDAYQYFNAGAEQAPTAVYPPYPS